MSKHRSKSAKRPAPQPPPRAKIARSVEQHPAVVKLLAAATLFGGLVAGLALLPRPSVSPPSLPFDAKDPFSVSFDISTLSPVPLDDVTAALCIGQLGGRDAQPITGLIFTYTSRLARAEWRHHKLGIDERFTISIADTFKNAAWADIAIAVSYRPWILPLRREKLFRFITHLESDGKRYWRSWPIDEPSLSPL